MASTAAALPQSTQHSAASPATTTGAGTDSPNVNLHPASEAAAELRRRKHTSATSVDEYPADDESEDKEKDHDDKHEVNWGKTPSGEGTLHS